MQITPEETAEALLNALEQKNTFRRSSYSPLRTDLMEQMRSFAINNKDAALQEKLNDPVYQAQVQAKNEVLTVTKELLAAQKEILAGTQAQLRSLRATNELTEEREQLLNQQIKQAKETVTTLARADVMYDFNTAAPGQKIKVWADQERRFQSTKADIEKEYALEEERASHAKSEKERKDILSAALSKRDDALQLAEAGHLDLQSSEVMKSLGMDTAMTALSEGIGPAVETAAGAAGAAIPVLGQILTIAEVIQKVIDRGFKKVDELNKKLGQGIEVAANMATQYLGSIDARLAGNKDNITYSTISNWMKDNFAVSPYISQQKLMQNIANVVENGIAYNVEERALIETIKDKMVATFDVLDTSLTRLIRLQQADLTSTQLGAEAQLTELLNTVFKDTSYLSGMYDSVSSAILDASSQFSYQDATAYNYNAQKWLAALYSVGMSDQAVSTIAQGLNYLSTGNVSAFTNDSQLTTLFGLAAKNANMSISDMFTNGLNATGVNNLMKSMIDYLQQIVKNTGNQVVKSAWGGITNLSVSDLRAIQNLSTSDISAIYDSNVSYTSALTKFNYELGQVEDRMSTAEKFSNLKDNFLLTLGQDVTNNGEGLAGYLAWVAGGAIGGKLGTVLQSFGIMSALPEALERFGLGAGDLLEGAWDTLVGAITGNQREISLGGLWNLDSESDFSAAISGWEAVLPRGEEYKGIVGVSSGTSSSGGVTSSNTAGSAAASGKSYGSFASTAENITAKTISGASSTVEKETSDIYSKLFEDEHSAPIRIKLVDLDSNLRDDLREQLIKDFHMENGGYMEEIRNMLVYGNVPVTLNGVLGGLLSVGGISNIIDNVRNS